MIRLARIPREAPILFLALWQVSLANAQPPGERFRIIRGVELNAPQGDMFSITELSPSVFIEEVGGETRGRVDRFEQFLTTEQWSEAVDMLIRLTEYEGNELVAAKGLAEAEDEFPRFVSVRGFANARLAALRGPARQVLSEYRERIDPLAEQRYELAVATRDEALLRRIADETLHSSVGAEALIVLGELALEKGHFDTARGYWLSIDPSLSWLAEENRLPYWQRLARGETVADVCQDIIKAAEASGGVGRISLERAWARFTLASILEGNPERAVAELAILRECWPEASGVIGGRQTNYVQFLSRFLEASRSWPNHDTSADWQTFAGNSQRNRVSALVIEIPTEPAWQIPLEPIPAANPQTARNYNVPIEKSGESSDFPSSHFPIVVRNLVFLHDKLRIHCLDLNTGMPAWQGGSDGAFYANELDDSQPPLKRGPFGAQQAMRLGEQRFTLSSNGKVLVATIGSHRGIGGTGNPALVGFDLAREGALQFGPVEVDDARWTFHGAPVCDDDRCWVGLRLRDVSAQDHVACFDIRSGQQLWRTRICSADTIGHNNVQEFANYLLTMHEGTIYFHSHLGCVAALNADDGKIRWLTKYPRQGPKRKNLVEEPWHALRDLTPCLYFEGMLIVAPSDFPGIFAIDALSGQLLWETEWASDATQLLGVGEESNLIVSGRRLWWLDVYTGKPSSKVVVNPMPAGAVSGPVGIGRGLLSGGNIYWPTEDDGLGKIFVLRQSDGQPARQPIDLEIGSARAGNLMITGSHLLIAAPDRLTAYELSGR